MAVHFLTEDSVIEAVGQPALQSLSDAYTTLYPGEEFECELVLVSLTEMQKLNLTHRQLDEPTDVLSFPTFSNLLDLHSSATSHPTLLGSIVINPEKAILYEESLIQLVHHGLLHLLGLDHETDITSWSREEKRILDILKYSSIDIPPVTL